MSILILVVLYVFAFGLLCAVALFRLLELYIAANCDD